MTEIEISTNIGDVIFIPTFIVKDKLNNPILHLRFNRKEKLVFYVTTEHTESINAAEKLKKDFIAVTKEHGEDWIVYDLMEYIKEKNIGQDEFKNLGIILIPKSSGEAM